MNGTVLFPYTSTFVGGSYVSSSLLVHYLRRRSEWDVRVCVPKRGENARLFETESFTPDSLELNDWDSMKVRHTRTRHQLPRYGIHFARALGYLLRHRPAIVHVNDLMSLHIWGLAAKTLRIPVVWHVRAEKTNPHDRHNLRLADQLILVANANRVRFDGIDPLPPVATVYNSVDFERFHPAEDRRAARSALGLAAEPLTIGFVGNLVDRKRPEWAVQAGIDLLAEGKDVQTIVVGRDYSEGQSYSRRLQATIDEAGATERVRLLGYRDDVPDLLRAFDVLVLASEPRGEAFPRAVIEAMASGAAVVATNVAGVPEAIDDGRTGLLADPNDYGDFLAKTRALVDDGNLRERIARASHEEATRRFSNDEIGRQILAIYEGVLERKGRRRR